jgi:hypothetical protein
VNLKEIGWKAVNWTHIVQERKKWWAVVNTIMHLRFA